MLKLVKVFILIIKLFMLNILIININFNTSANIITNMDNGEYNTDSVIYIDVVEQKYVSNNDKVKFIFNIFDNFPKNNYLNYNEVALFQKLTDPQLPLTIIDYKLVCKMLNSNYLYGISLSEFNSSYYLFKHDLGTDLSKDYDIIYNLFSNNVVSYNSNYM